MVNNFNEAIDQLQGNLDQHFPADGNRNITPQSHPSLKYNLLLKKIT